jgi:hypothetical protein
MMPLNALALRKLRKPQESSEPEVQVKGVEAEAGNIKLSPTDFNINF